MTIVPSGFPGSDDVGSLWWRISVRKPDGTFVTLAGHSDTHDTALRDMVVKARAYMQQNPGPYSGVVALHVDKNYLQVQGGVIGESLSVDEAAHRRATAAASAQLHPDIDRDPVGALDVRRLGGASRRTIP